MREFINEEIYEFRKNRNVFEIPDNNLPTFCVEIPLLRRVSSHMEATLHRLVSRMVQTDGR